MGVYDLTNYRPRRIGAREPWCLRAERRAAAAHHRDLCALWHVARSAVVVTAQDPDADRERIHIDTDKDGAVWPSASASGREPAERTGSVARETEHARAVHRDTTIKKDD